MGFRPSYLWRSLMAAREIVVDGAAWRIEDGRSVLQWRDRWIGVKNMRQPATTSNDTLVEKRVASLIDHQLGIWRKELIINKFVPEDAQNILSMPLSANQLCDRRIWRYTKTGHFSVKSAYNAAVEKYSMLNINMDGPSLVPKGWKRMWTMKTIPKVCLFVWRICSNSLPTKDNLCRRGSIVDPMCGLCGEEVETIDHLLMQCPRVVPVWYVSMARLDMSTLGHNSFKEFLWAYMDSHPLEFVSLLAYLAWEIWQHRVLFQNRNFIFSEVVTKAQGRWGEFQSTQVSSNEKKSETVERRWERPPIGKLKVNCDVAVNPNDWIGLGFVIRNHNGEVSIAAKTEIMADGTTTILEGLAIRYALKMARQYHVNIDIVESDKMSIVNFINGRAEPDIFADIIVEEIRALKHEVGWFEVRHTHRSGNGVAHAIATVIILLA